MHCLLRGFSAKYQDFWPAGAKPARSIVIRRPPSQGIFALPCCTWTFAVMLSGHILLVALVEQCCSMSTPGWPMTCDLSPLPPAEGVPFHCHSWSNLMHDGRCTSLRPPSTPA